MEVRAKLKELFGIDIRSLALFRIGLALVILGDIFYRLQDLTVFYTDEGVLPRQVVIEDILPEWVISFHLANGTWLFQLALFILQAIFAVALLIGFHTRLATVLSWIFIVSLHLRNIIILQGGDIVLNVLLFWAMFLPLGAYWSWDSWKSKEKYAFQIISGGTVGLLLQVCFIYWFTALMKIDPSWTTEGSAIWYALSIEQYAKPMGTYLLQFPQFLKGLTFATLFLEGIGPFFAFSPIWTGPLRTATVCAFLLFHMIGLNLTMQLSLFPYVCAVAWLVFLPKWFWGHIYGTTNEGKTPWKASLVSNVLAIFFLVYVFLWNVNTLGLSKSFIPSPVAAVGLVTNINQTWDMFSPYPLQNDGWYVIPGKLRDGTEIDLLNDHSPVSWEKPASLADVYRNDRWRSYMMNLFMDDDTSMYLRGFAEYLCAEWNDTHPYNKEVMRFEIDYMVRANTYMGPPAPYEKVILWEHICLDD